MTDRGRDVSAELTEVRTVLSRAENARETLRKWQDGTYTHRVGWDPATRSYDRTILPPDADVAEMIAALDVVVERLSRWRRTGRAPKVKR